MEDKDIIVRFDDRLITINTLKSLVSAYWFFKMYNAFKNSPKQELTFKMYKSHKVTLIYR